MIIRWRGSNPKGTVVSKASASVLASIVLPKGEPTLRCALHGVVHDLNTNGTISPGPYPLIREVATGPLQKPVWPGSSDAPSQDIDARGKARSKPPLFRPGTVSNPPSSCCSCTLLTATTRAKCRQSCTRTSLLKEVPSLDCHLTSISSCP